ncbi:MAG: hypothetical protein UE295_02430 [Acutalibacteraceae bacterium]|nr:hypothetical protein [Acutalibacteraceae bacterium]
MNVLLICGKEMQKNLETMCSRARNKRVIGTVTQVDDNIVELVKTTYRPHCIIWAQGIDFKTDTSELDLILSLQNEFPSTRIIVNHGKRDELTTALVENDIYDVVARIVTDIEFLSLLNTPLSSKEEFERFNKDTHKTKTTTKQRKKVVVNNKPIFVFLAVIMFVTISFVAIVKNKQTATITAEDTTEASYTIATEYVTDYLLLDSYDSPTEKETEKPTEEPTEEETEPPTEKKEQATEKTDKDDKDVDENKEKNEQDNSSNISQAQVQQPVQQAPQQSVQLQQPVQQPQQQYIPQVQQPIQQPQQSMPQVQQPVQQPDPIVDDGLIYFDKDSYTVAVGGSFDVYVTGLATSSGCKWTLTNSAIAEFVSSDTAIVTIKAKAKGSTVITCTAKSNGATRQVLVTVK